MITTMKNAITSIILFVLVISSAVGQEKEAMPRVLFSVEKFFHPTEGNYVELYWSFDASSFKHVPVAGGFQCNVEVGYIIKNALVGTKSDKYVLNGPVMEQEGLRQDFLDVQTVLLKPGSYTIEIFIRDKNREMEPITAVQNIDITFKKKEAAMSKPMLLKTVEQADEFDKVTKNGLKIDPWLIASVPEFMDHIYLYSEVYNTDFAVGSQGAYVERHALRNLDVDSVFSAYNFMKRVKADDVNVIVKKVDLKEIPSGNYVYTIELLDREQRVVAFEGVEFYRNSSIPKLTHKVNVVGLASFEALINSETNRDTLVDYFRSLWPLADIKNQQFINRNWKHAEAEVLQQFIISFWRAEKPENPYNEWIRYRQLLKVVDEEFGYAGRPGYETDRGMVYLRYGKPDQMVKREQEPSSYPYIIWQYYSHPIQTNAMYVFWDKSLTLRNYELLHSNVRGEISNPRWQLLLQSRNNPNVDVDQERGVEHWGGRADEYYTNPR